MAFFIAATVTLVQSVVLIATRHW